MSCGSQVQRCPEVEKLHESSAPMVTVIYTVMYTGGPRRFQGLPLYPPNKEGAGGYENLDYL